MTGPPVALLAASILIISSGAVGPGVAVTGNLSTPFAETLSSQPGLPVQALTDLGVIVHPHHQRSMALASDLLAISHRSGAYDFSKAIALAKRVTWGQGELLGFGVVDPIPLMGFSAPGEALRELAWRHGVELTLEERRSIQRLDGLPEPLASALARFVDAFLALDLSGRVLAREAWQKPWKEEPAWALATDPRHWDIPTWLDAPRPTSEFWHPDLPAIPTSESDPWLAPIFATRVQFLEMIEDLQSSLMSQGVNEARSCDPVAVPLLFSIDLTTCNNTYADSYVLLLDAGGDDLYVNNAGGSNIQGGTTCATLSVQVRAALVDLGSGSDRYGDDAHPFRRCGVNGGGYNGGMGFLLDDGGDDAYSAYYIATNGGGHTLGMGFLLDASGHDIYKAGSGGTNGGGKGGFGVLVDAQGDDTFVAGGGGTNGGGASSDGTLRASGILVDLAGNDQYAGENLAVNGGGFYTGAGFLFDRSGDDLFAASHAGVNGGGYYYGGVGFLIDYEGNDRFLGTFAGVNGGGHYLGQGFLLDMAGDDAYSATQDGANGGGCLGGRGTLLDLDGDDAYKATYRGANGGAGVCAVLTVPIPAASGLLFDGSGTDSYYDFDTDCSDCTVVPKGAVGGQVDSRSWK